MTSIDDILAEVGNAYREAKNTDHLPLALSTLLRRAIDADERLQNTPVSNDDEVQLLALSRTLLVSLWAQFAGIDSEQAEAEFMFQAYGHAG